MKKSFCLFVTLLFSVSFTIGQTKGKSTIRKPAPVSKFAVAERAWVSFWNEFMSATRNRDKTGLKQLVSKDFGCIDDGNDCSSEKNDDRVEIFFQAAFGEWEFLERFVFDKKAARIGKIKTKESRITREITNLNFPGNGTFSFSYESDGKWYIAGYDYGCTV